MGVAVSGGVPDGVAGATAEGAIGATVEEGETDGAMLAGALPEEVGAVEVCAAPVLVTAPVEGVAAR